MKNLEGSKNHKSSPLHFYFIKGGRGSTGGKMTMYVYLPKENIELPFSCSLITVPDSIMSNLTLVSELSDSSKGYMWFKYRINNESPWQEYSEVISGEFTITRYDTIVSGTFETIVLNGENNFTITEGKFDYEL